MSPRFEIDPLDEGLESELTVDDVVMLVLAAAIVLGLLILIGIGSVSAGSRLEAVITRLDHDVFSSKRAEDMDVIDLNKIKHDVTEKPVPTLWHDALGSPHR